MSVKVIRPTVLVVCDMQEDFPIHQSLLDNAANYIKNSRYDKIAVIEYLDSGETHNQIQHALADKNFFVLDKQEDDGSANLVDEFKHQFDTTPEVDILGIYTDFCIRSTARGLAKKKVTTNILFDFTQSRQGILRREFIDGIKDLRNVHVLGTKTAV